MTSGTESAAQKNVGRSQGRREGQPAATAIKARPATRAKTAASAAPRPTAR